MAEPKESTGIERRPRILDALGSGGLPEDQARSLAEDFVRHARDGSGRVLWRNRVYATAEGHAGARKRLARWAEAHGVKVIDVKRKAA